MQRDFSTTFSGGDSAEDCSFDAIFSGVSLQSFLTEKCIMPFYTENALGDPALGFPANSRSTAMTTPFPINFLGEDCSALKYRNQLGQKSVDEGHRLGTLNFGDDTNPNHFKLRLPKPEPFYPTNEFDTSLTPAQTPFNYFTNPTSDLKLSSHFYHLPHMHSLEQSQGQALSSASTSKRTRVPTSKRARPGTSASDPQTLESIVQSCYYLKHPVVLPQSKVARRRRQKLSEKMQSLKELMPWDNKLDMATMLEEAHKYVRFLKTQIKILHAMPLHSCCAFPSAQSSDGGVFGNLGRLTRNQVLQVLVNSPVAQTVLYSSGCCVFSVEQLSNVTAQQEMGFFNP